MAKPLLKKNCGFCGKGYFTRDEGLEFCNTLCGARFEYNKTFFNKEPALVEAVCAYCKETVVLKKIHKSAKRRFCGKYCQKQMEREESAKERAENPKPRSRGKPKPYSVLNKMSEKERVLDKHHSSWYVRRGESYK